MLRLLKLNIRTFARLRRNDKKVKKIKDSNKRQINVDDKNIKISKKDQKKEIMLTEEEKIKLNEIYKEKLKNHDFSVNTGFSKFIIKEYKSKINQLNIDLVENPLQTYDILNETIEENQEKMVERVKERERLDIKAFENLSILNFEGQNWKKKENKMRKMNAERIVNEKYDIKKVKPSNPMSRRCGVIGYKMGMTNIFNKWGKAENLTVLQIDRCQITQIKTDERDGYTALQVGAGNKSLNTIKRAQIGTYLKAGVPPKKDIVEFKVNKENILPLGYMIGVRHFTPGQFVDVEGRTTGKGFMGVMKRYNFKGQPASHGTSLAHRSLGATGACQDPGRVWKGKKMPGRHGNKKIIIRKLQVYKIDYSRSLIYLKGSVPGPVGRAIKISDCFFNWEKNEKILNYPTFIFDKEITYPDIIQIKETGQDPAEVWLHENDVLKDRDKDEVAIDEED